MHLDPDVRAMSKSQLRGALMRSRWEARHKSTHSGDHVEQETVVTRLMNALIVGEEGEELVVTLRDSDPLFPVEIRISLIPAGLRAVATGREQRVVGVPGPLRLLVSKDSIPDTQG